MRHALSRAEAYAVLADDPPRYSEARKKLSRKLGAALFNESVSRSEAVLSNGNIIKP